MGSKFTYKKSVFSLTFLMSLLSLSGCSSDPEIHKEGFFEYIILEPGRYWYNGENKSIAIVGFTESGLEQESIRIPKKINDIPVEYIGYEGTNGAHAKAYFYNPKINQNDRLKNIYFYDNICFFTTIESDLDTNNMLKRLNVFNCSKNKRVVPDFQTFNFYWYNFENLNLWMEYLLPNVIFVDSIDGENYYSLDNVLSGEIIIEPEEPKYDSQAFKGWFIEPECINKYNFENPIFLENDERLFLYAGWDKNQKN